MPMSSDLYSRILYWDGHRGRGIVKTRDVTVQLHVPPEALPHIAEIDFREVQFGEKCVAQIRETTGVPSHEMDSPQADLVKAWLVEFEREVLIALKAHHEHFRVEAVDEDAPD